MAVEGTFDDCQDLVKALFADAAFRDELRSSAMNSINWARIAAQIPYYVAAPRRRGRPGRVRRAHGQLRQHPRRLVRPADGGADPAPGRRLATATTSSPGGSTGATGVAEVEPTLSPSMDIQVSSNLERLLFELLGRDGRATAELMQPVPRRVGSVEAPAESGVPGRPGRRRRDPRRDRRPTARRPTSSIRTRRSASHVARTLSAGVRRPVVCLATAHPAKFPDAVEQATGIRRPELPERLADLLDRPERYDVLPTTWPSQCEAHIAEPAYDSMTAAPTVRA